MNSRTRFAKAMANLARNPLFFLALLTAIVCRLVTGSFSLAIVFLYGTIALIFFVSAAVVGLRGGRRQGPQA